jgi:hypothetical protein
MSTIENTTATKLTKPETIYNIGKFKVSYIKYLL